MLRITATVLFFCSIVSLSYGQDSTKKATPVKPSPASKPYKYHSYRSRAKADSIAKAQAAQTGGAKTDTPHALPPVTDNSLNAQYLRLVDRFYPHQEAMISAFWKNALDTLNVTRNKLKTAESKLNGQRKTADTVAKEPVNEEKPVPVTTTASNNVNVLGIVLSKTAYNLIVWGLVIIFGLTAVIVVARSGSYSREAKYRTQLYGELEDEFKAYKAKANDKEKKLARELQTERNKLDELLGRS
jgi:hypothetical protein